MPDRHRRRARRLLVLAALALLGGVVGLPLLGAGLHGADAVDLPYTLEVTPTASLADGDAVTVMVHAAVGQRVGISGKVSICRDGETYTTTNDILPFVGGKCPDKPVSSSASGPWPIRPYPNGSTALGTIRVGTGTVEWGPATAPTQFNLTCDPTHPCRLVVEIPMEGGQRYIDSSTLLTFSDDNPIGSCGGSNPAAITSGGPDRLLGAWVDWTRAQCTATSSQASTQAVLAGEGEGQDSFHAGTVDLTYSAVGPSFPGDPPATPRAGVPVPVALNAVVVGMLGGYPTAAPDWPSNVPRPFGSVQVTMAEMATLFGKGPFSFGAESFPTMQSRNAELLSVAANNSEKPNPQAPAGAGTVSWLASSAFDALAPDQWKTPPLMVTGNPPDVPRGVHESFALASPPFVPALFDLYSSQANLKKLVAENEFKPYNYGPIWILTDLATARELGIPTAALQNGAGEFVAPTDAALQAAASTFETQADGTVLPDIDASAPGAYPLTFVEQAVAPAEPLLDAACTPRTASQALLAGWLEFVTGPGQASLPEGLIALTPDLAAAASTQRAKVGASEPTGDCAPEETTTTTSTTTPTSTPRGTENPNLPPNIPPSGPGSGPTGGGPTGPTGFASGPLPGDGGSDGDDGGPDDSGDDGAESDEDDDGGAIDLPGLASSPGARTVAGAGALLGLAVLGGVGGAMSSGRRIRWPWRGSK